MSYIVRKFDFNKHAIELFSLWKKVLKNPSQSRFDAMYSDSEMNFHTWLLFTSTASNQERMIGSVSVMTRIYSLTNRRVLVGVNVDMLVDKAYRTLGPALILVRQMMHDCQAGMCDIVIAMPNVLSAAVVKRAGYVFSGHARQLNKVLRSRSKVAAHVSNVTLQILVSVVVDTFLYVLSGEFLMLLYSILCRYTYSDQPISDSTLSIMDADGNSASVLRDTQWLQRRYGKIHGNSVNFFSQSSGGHLRVLIVYSLVNNQVVIEDMLTLSNSGNVACALSAFIQLMRSSRKESLSVLYYGNRQMRFLLAFFGFIARGSRAVYSFSQDSDLIKSFSEKETQLSLFEGELDL